MCRGGAHRAIVLGDALQRFPRQVQPVKIGIVAFQQCHDADCLGIVVKPPIGGHHLCQRILAGVAKGGVAQIMGQRHGLCQIGIKPKCACDGARDLRHLNRMGQARAVIIALMLYKNLCLVLEPAKGRGMDDPVAISLKRVAKGR